MADSRSSDQIFVVSYLTLRCGLVAGSSSERAARSIHRCSCESPRQRHSLDEPRILVLPISTGSETDHLARLIGEKMSANWGRGWWWTIGVCSLLAMRPSARPRRTLHAVADEYIAVSATTTQPAFDLLKDFAGVAQIGYGNAILVVTLAMRVNSLRIFRARQRPTRQQDFGFMAVSSGPFDRRKIQLCGQHQGENRGVQSGVGTGDRSPGRTHPLLHGSRRSCSPLRRPEAAPIAPSHLLARSP